jgi:arginyl-tRNA--protein-N-Asp/Glu arginylyltransferase
MTTLKSPVLYLTPESRCDYLPGRLARTLFIPAGTSTGRYSELIARGFRRSGSMVYRPDCRGCASCIPVRIPVQRFQPNRIQARILLRNADLSVHSVAPAFREEHYALFTRYLSARHADSIMLDSTPRAYMEFLSSDWCQTLFHEFRFKDLLVAIAVVDHLNDALSAVYTFFDPVYGQRSLGTFAVLWQIREAQRLGFRWLYLGYWIEQCRKMSYKSQYRPLEAYRGGTWACFEKGEKIRPDYDTI